MKNIAIYLRLSLADSDLGDNGKNESNSIENQRLLIRNYLCAHQEIIGDVVEYKDDGYTGLNFDRPAFRQMIEDAKKGTISTIVVKDFSRFGRDYIGVGDYIEQILPALGVRLIAINSKYDSAEQGDRIVNLDVSISNMINAMYSRDISKKISSICRAKWEKGMNTTARVPYGYMIRKDDPTLTPVIDEEAAVVVRQIFQLALLGLTSKDIAEQLNARNILIPSEYKKRKFGIRQGKTIGPESERLWTTHMVVVIIKRYDYTGARIHGKIENIGVGLGKKRQKDKSDWIIVENNHEPIISKEEYELAQLMIEKKAYPTKFHKHNYDLLAGKVRCGCCGHLMQFKQDIYLYCQHASDVGSKSKCSRDFYDALSVRNSVLLSLKAHIELMADVGSALKEKKQKTHAIVEETIDSLRNRVEKLNEDFVRQYENYVNGNLPREKFIAVKNKITSERTQLEMRISEIEKNRMGEDAVSFEVNRIVNIGQVARNYCGVTREILDALMDDIRITVRGEVEIRYKFEDLYAQAHSILNG